MSLLAEAQELTSKKTANDYQFWCEGRIKVLSKRIKSHAQRGSWYIDINDSKYKAKEVYKHFKKEGFTIKEKKSYWDTGDKGEEWDGSKPLETKHIIISWANEQLMDM